MFGVGLLKFTKEICGHKRVIQRECGQEEGHISDMGRRG